MSTSEVAPVPEPAMLRRVVLSSLIGTTVEYYDFVLYATMTALVFDRLFFPPSIRVWPLLPRSRHLRPAMLRVLLVESSSGTSEIGWAGSECLS